MRLLLNTAAALCATILTSLYAFAAPHTVSRPHHDPSTPQWSEGALWRSDRGFDSYLRLKNVLLNQPLTVTPVLYMADGYEVDLAPLTLDPAGVASINIPMALRQAGSAAGTHSSAYGMAGVKYQWSWSAVLATVQNIDEVESITFHSSLAADAEAVHDPSAPKADRLIQGLWWAPGALAAGFVALENTGQAAATAQVAFTDAQGSPLAQKSVPLAPHATTLLSLEDMLAKVKSPTATGSINITYNGAAHGILAYEGIEDRQAGYSASPNLVEVSSDTDIDPPPPGLVQLAAPGVMVGAPKPDMLFPAQTVFQPYAYLQNRSTRQLSVDVSAIPVQGGTPTKLGTVNLAPNATTQIDLPGMMKRANFNPASEYVTLLFSYQGVPSDVLAEAGSTDQTRNYVFEVSPTAEAATISKTICYWLIGGDTDTMISVWNYTAAPSDELLTLYFARGQYKVLLHLAPGETRVFNVKAIQRDQIPDADGHVLPTTITEGSALLSVVKGETEKMPVVTSVATFNVRNATCGPSCISCNGISEFVLSPGSDGLAPAQMVQFSGVETYNTGSTQSTTTGAWSSSSQSVATVNGSGATTAIALGQSTIELVIDDVPVAASSVCAAGGNSPSCPMAFQMGGSGSVRVTPSVNISGPASVPLAASGISGAIRTITLTAAGAPAGGIYTWAVSNPATVSLSSTSGPSVIVASQLPGPSSVSVTYVLNGQSATSAQTEVVQQPTSYRIFSDTGTTQNTDCASLYDVKYNGDQRSVGYQPIDQYGNVILNAGMPAVETFSDTTSTCNITPTAKNGVTDSGYWYDQFLLCTSKCLPANAAGQPTGSCQIQTTHTWAINGFQVFNHTLTYTCTSIIPQ